jgi:hypothetical protein
MDKGYLPGGIILVALALAVYAVVFPSGERSAEPQQQAGDTSAQTAAATPAVQAEPGQPGPGEGPATRTAARMVGAWVYDADGAPLGEIEDVVRSVEDDSLHAVIAVGGMWGLFERRAALALDSLQPFDGGFQAPSDVGDAEQLYARPSFDLAAYRSVAGEPGAWAPESSGGGAPAR